MSDLASILAPESTLNDLSGKLSPAESPLLKMAQGLSGLIGGQNPNVTGTPPVQSEDFLPQLPKNKTDLALLLMSVLAPSAKLGFELKNSAQKAKPLMEKINSKDTLWHTTGLDKLRDILRSGKLKPGNPETGPLGVSTSRVPLIESMKRDVHLELDPRKMAKSVPFAEYGYQKGSHSTGQPFAKGINYNPFEFETRVLGDVPLNKTLRNVFYDPEYLPQRYDPGSLEDLLSEVKQLLGKQGVNLTPLSEKALPTIRMRQP